MGNKIEILEVGPRDGFQNLNEYVGLEHKLMIIDNLIAAGVRHIQHTSFVSPKVVPQFKDSEEITKIVLDKYPDFDFISLVPNFYGAKMAYDLGLKKITYVISLGESHNKANINRTHEESFNILKDIIGAYKDLKICVDIPTVFGCPFEGKFKIKDIVNFIDKVVNLGITEITLADTIGIAYPNEVREIVNAVKIEFPDIDFGIHMHDTKNRGIGNTLAAVECGITKIDSSLGGLGGCPFPPGVATGNIATEDIVYKLKQMGYETGIDFDKLLKAALHQTTIIDGKYSGQQMKRASNPYKDK